MKYLRTFLLLFPVWLIACEEPVDWNTPEGIPVLTVDGMITNEQTKPQVILKWSSPFLDGNFPAASGATVLITDLDTICYLPESSLNPGHYNTQGNVQGVLNKTYYLRINLNGRTYSASTSMVPVTPMTEMMIRPSGNNDSLYTLVPQESDIPAMIEYRLDWSDVTGYDTLPPEKNHAFLRYFTLQNIDANAIFKPTEEEIFFPRGTKIVRKKYALSPGYQEYWRTLLSETAWRGSIFDVEPGNIATNLSEGATGYFAACTVLSDSLVW
jgi:hypothetical protein